MLAQGTLPGFFLHSAAGGFVVVTVEFFRGDRIGRRVLEDNIGLA